MTRRANRIDGNQQRLDELARNVGAVVIHASAAPELGFDRIYLRAGVVFLCEIKDGAKPPSHRQLTEREKATKRKVEDAGGTYWIIENDADLLTMFGLQ